MKYPQARYSHSTHFNERPNDQSVDLIVVHNISLPPDEFGSCDIEDFFCGQLNPTKHPYFETIHSLRVSSHFLIRRDGEVIQFVDTDKRAWHAGESCWENRANCNDFSVGIELEGSDHTPFEKVQYDRLADLVLWLQSHYPDITSNRIVGHSDIAPNRKTDPGPFFDWDYFRKQINV